RIEWPSGIVQVLRDVAADRRLHIVEDSTTPVLGSVLRSEASAGALRIEWSLPGWSGREVVVQRAERAGDWLDRERVGVDARGVAAFVDAAPVASGRCGYRLRLRATPGPAIVRAAWNEPPSAARFGISHAWPNAGSGPIQVQFELDSCADAVLDLVDVGGRCLATEALPSPRPGAHVRTLPSAGLATGVYYARLRQSGRSSAARVVFVR